MTGQLRHLGPRASAVGRPTAITLRRSCRYRSGTHVVTLPADVVYVTTSQPQGRVTMRRVPTIVAGAALAVLLAALSATPSLAEAASSARGAPPRSTAVDSAAASFANYTVA